MNEHTRCAIWNTPAKENHNSRDGRSLISAHAGGEYFISRTAETVLQAYGDNVKLCLTNWLVTQRRLGASWPEISAETIRNVELYGTKKMSERTDSILRYLESKSEMLGEAIPFRNYYRHNRSTQLEKPDIAYLEFLAHSGCTNEEEFFFLLNCLVNLELIKIGHIHDEVKTCALTARGYARLEELNKTFTASSKAFVAMWFDSSMIQAWNDGFDPAIREAGYEPVRIDQQDHLNKIDDEIIAEIRRSRFVVADFSHGDEGARGGVYYEAGFAHGLDVPVIFTCRQDSFDEIHFDTRQYPHIVWTEPEELREKLKKRIAAVIGDGPNKTQY